MGRNPGFPCFFGIRRSKRARNLLTYHGGNGDLPVSAAMAPRLVANSAPGSDAKRGKQRTRTNREKWWPNENVFPPA